MAGKEGGGENRMIFWGLFRGDGVASEGKNSWLAGNGVGRLSLTGLEVGKTDRPGESGQREIAGFRRGRE